MTGKVLLILVLAIILAGCSQMEEKLTVENKHLKKLEELSQYLINKELLIEKAKEIGFNTQIIGRLYNELKENPMNQNLITLLEFYLDALMQEKVVSKPHKELANSLAEEIKIIGSFTRTCSCSLQISISWKKR